MTEKRKALTRTQLLVLMLEQEGRCGCGCGVKLNPVGEGVIDEHWNPLGLTGTNDTENRRLLRKPCASKKTPDDVKRIAKAKRQGLEAGQQARRAKNGPTLKGRSSWPPKGKTKWPKRPMSKRENNGDL